jgi:indolepyruvate ferredoxin oxidoreductase beta subunit
MNSATARNRPISIAIFALGGEGGGVLADWIVALAERGGYLAQTTSVPGVAQRTGATIYYLELFAREAASTAGRDPVLALMPIPGDVDVVIGSELMEAARAVERGFVTPDRTMLIASTHRVYAIGEKIALADGRADGGALLEACRAAARRLVAFDMEAIADATSSVVSSVLLGALAGSRALPFPRVAFESAMRASGIGGVASLAAFTAGFEAATNTVSRQQARPEGPADAIDRSLIDSLMRGFDAAISSESRSTLRTGVARLIDYQDPDYAREYLRRLHPILDIERRRGDGQQRLLGEAGRQLALAMSYEDTIRVAELKIRPERFARIRAESKFDASQIFDVVEFMHPRVQEIADTLPARLGRWLLRTGWARRAVERFTGSGKAIRTTSISGFLLLYLIASLKPWRRRSLRFAAEQTAIDKWLDTLTHIAESDYQLAIEVAKCRGVVKGYGDTHARGNDRFNLLIGALPRLMEGPSAAAAFASLEHAARADEQGSALRERLSEIEAGKRTARAQ